MGHGKIVSGWEYREDAKEFIDDHPRRNLRVYTAKGAKRLGFDRWANLHSLSRRRNPYTATETPTGKTTRGWITREGKLGGAGYTEKSAATRHRLLTRSVDVFGYRSTLGSLQALLRGRMGDDKKKKVQADKNWLMRQYQAN